jgi:Transposase domain (DUF772)
MSLQPRPWPEPIDAIATAVREMYAGRRAPLPVVIWDESGELFADEALVEAFCGSGHAGLVTGAVGVGDRVCRWWRTWLIGRRGEAVRDKISWKRALGLGLTDAGFDFSVLSEFRKRVADNGLEARALDLLVARLVDTGLIKARGKQRTDSTCAGRGAGPQPSRVGRGVGPRRVGGAGRGGAGLAG